MQAFVAQSDGRGVRRTKEASSMLSNLKQSDREEVEQALFLLPQIMEPLRGQPQLPAQIVRLLMAEGISARNAIFAVRCAFEQGSLVIGDGQNALVLALNRGVG